jgi:hypothetical protein
MVVSVSRIDVPMNTCQACYDTPPSRQEEEVSMTTLKKAPMKEPRVDVHIKVSNKRIKLEAMSRAVLLDADLGRITEALWKMWLDGSIHISPNLIEPK